MSKSITQINTTTDTFQIWVNRTNETINAISVECVTTNTHANGGLTTGNGFVEGTFGARNLVANTVRGGTVQTSGLLTITSNVEVTGAKVTMGNVVINSTDIVVGDIVISALASTGKISVNTAGVSAQEINSFSKIDNRGAEYVLTIKDLNANAYQISKVLAVHDSGSAYITEFAVVYSNNSLGTISADANGTHIRTYLTPTVANTHVSGSVVLIAV